MFTMGGCNMTELETAHCILLLERITDTLEKQTEVQKELVEQQKVWWETQTKWREQNRELELVRHNALLRSEEKNQKLLDIRLKQEEEYAESRKKWNTSPVTPTPTDGDKSS